MRVRDAIIAMAALVAGCRSEAHARHEYPDADANLAMLSRVPDLLMVPRMTGTVHLDGELNEPDWAHAARTGPFRDARNEIAHPYSDARFLRDDDNLYLGLYAADEDIEPARVAHDGPVWTGDAFSVRIFGSNASRIDISPAEVVTDARTAPGLDLAWESGIRLAVDRDGTMGDATDEDEEWVVEAAIPIASLCGTGECDSIALELSRCDKLRNGPRLCASWGSSRGQTVRLTSPRPGSAPVPGSSGRSEADSKGLQ